MKSPTTLILATLLIGSCSKPNSTVTKNDENEKIIRQYYELFNQHEWEKMAELYTETSEFKDPSLGAGIIKQTRPQIIEKYSELGKMFPDVKDEITQIYHSGEKHLIVEFTSTGTGPDSSTFNIPICTIFTIENGKITKDYTYYDNF